MAFRTDTQDFPYSDKDRSIWYFIIDWKKKIKTHYCYIQEKRDMVSLLKQLIDKGKYSHIQLCGVWQGNWKTDIFDLPIHEAYNTLKDVYPQENIIESVK